MFQFGYKKTKYIRSSKSLNVLDNNDSSSFLNATLDCTHEDSFVTEQAIKREIRSYGIISIKEEKVEYVGNNAAESFVLFDASN